MEATVTLDSLAERVTRLERELAKTQARVAELQEELEEADDVRAAIEAEARLARGESQLRPWAEVDADLAALPD